MFDRALQINPNDANIYYRKGVSLGLLDKIDESIQMFDMAYEINPNLCDVNHKKG